MTQLAEPTTFSVPISLAPHKASAFVFEDPASHALLARIERIGPSDANVMVVGETGSGKELIARMLHARSVRASRRFVAVNCGALSESLAESELFGHERGAFTGAAAAKSGWFEAANGGTLFLDEIGDLPLSIQVKLLRMLQEREVVRLGSRTAVPIDVRVISATHVNLAHAVSQGRFREDLYYRLRVGAIEAHPLRARRNDILPLARYFVTKHNTRDGAQPVSIADDAAALLLSHAWPGNIRELENVIHSALVDAHEGVLSADAIRHAMTPEFTRTRVPASHRDGETEPLRRTPAADGASSAASPAESALERALLGLFEAGTSDLFDRIEGEIVSAAYRFCHRNQVQTARLLGLSRNIVRARLIKIGELEGDSRSRARANALSNT